jgi:hypothetical protein
MALAQPGFVLASYAQALTTTVTLSTYTSISGWTVSAILRAYDGGATLATGTATPTDTGSVASWSIAWTATDLTQQPGAYVWSLLRTNSGYEFPIVDPSAFIIQPSAASAYPTLTNLSEYLAHAMPDATISDSQAKQMVMHLAAAEARVKKYTNRDFVYRATQTEYYDGNGTDKLRLRRTPVVISSVAISVDRGGHYGQATDPFASETALTLGEDYEIAPDSRFGDALNHSGIVQRIAAIWPYRMRRQPRYLSQQREPLPGCIKATYSAGYQLIPYDLKLAVWDLATMYRVGSTWGQVANSESGEGYSRSLGGGGQAGQSDLPMHVKAILDQYRDGGSYFG